MFYKIVIKRLIARTVTLWNPATHITTHRIEYEKNREDIVNLARISFGPEEEIVVEEVLIDTDKTAHSDKSLRIATPIVDEIKEFPDDDSAMLWFMLEYGG